MTCRLGVLLSFCLPFQPGAAHQAPGKQIKTAGNSLIRSHLLEREASCVSVVVGGLGLLGSGFGLLQDTETVPDLREPSFISTSAFSSSQWQ